LRPQRDQFGAAAHSEDLVERRAAGESDRDDREREEELRTFSFVIYSAATLDLAIFWSALGDGEFRTASINNKSHSFRCRRK